jgi:flavin-dependent dehydrogenase
LPYDIVIVGGGPAGISTALHLSACAPRLASRTIVLEKERYPRDKICAGAIGGRGLRALARIGVAFDASHVSRVPHVPVRGMSFGMAGGRFGVMEDDLGVVVRRVEFDHALAREAMRRGIEVREGVAVQGLDVTARGVRLETSTGPVEARALVGADGVAGVVRRAAGFARASMRAQAVEVDTDRASGDASDLLHFDFAAADLNGYAWDFPTLVDGQPKTCRGVYRFVRNDRDNARERLRVHLRRSGLSLEDHEVRAFAEQGFDPRVALSKPRVLLVGEAAGVDFLSGEGIAQGIQYGALAAPFLAEALRSGDLSFSRWSRRVLTSSLGRQLIRRLVYMRLLFNPARDAVEPLVRDIPSAVRMGMKDFAGKPIRGWSGLVREIGPALLSHGGGIAALAVESALQSARA